MHMTTEGNHMVGRWLRCPDCGGRVNETTYTNGEMCLECRDCPTAMTVDLDPQVPRRAT